MRADAAPLLIAWSGGKDCTLALREIQRGGEYAVAALLTTVTAGYDRVSMHGVRRSLVRAQAASLGLPLHEVEIPPVASNEEYEARMDAAIGVLRRRTPGLVGCAFGDLFLEDVRAYRERMLARAGLRAVFPLWGRNTAALARELTALGYRARVVCVDAHAIPAALAGREYDGTFLRELPGSADPCGENGEFHTFVYDGPGFARPISCAAGEIVVRDERFVFADLVQPSSAAGVDAEAVAAARPAS